MRTAGTRLVAVALGEASGRLVLEVGLPGGGGGATSPDGDPHGDDDDDQRETGDGEHDRLHRQPSAAVDPLPRPHRYTRAIPAQFTPPDADTTLDGRVTARGAN